MSKLNKRIITSILLFFILYLSLNYKFVLILLLLLLSFFVLIEIKYIFKKMFKKSLTFFLSMQLVHFYTVFFCLIIFNYLVSFDYNNRISIILLLIICITTDLGGYVFGKLIGGKKLIKISPNKTYSGMLGSFIFAFLFGYWFYIFYVNNILLNINIFFLIFVVSLISQLGDLFISFFKRKAKVKDTGKILPGHGGVLDRIDGILFAIPIGIILLTI